MWMAIAGVKSDAADLLFGISPDIFWEPAKSLYLVDLRKVYRYWSLDKGFATLLGQQSFLESSELRFVVAPTAALSAMLVENLQTNSQIYLSSQMAEVFGQAPINFLLKLQQADVLSGELVSYWSRVIEDFEDLGFKTLSDLCSFQLQQELILRWGKPLQKRLSLLLGKSDWILSPFEPQASFVAHANLALEKQMGSDFEVDFFKRLEAIFLQWDARLKVRRLRIGGVRLNFRSINQNNMQTLTLKVPRALSSAQAFLPMINERWTLLSSESGDVDYLAEFQLESLGLEPDYDVQLHLMEPDLQSLDQSWSQAIGHMYSFSKQEGDVRFGTYVPGLSYLPESSLKWADDVLNASLPPIDDHPARPTLLLKKPEPLALFLSSYEAFVEWAIKQGVFLNLEKLANPWTKDSGLRVYAKFQEQWLFWSFKDRQVYCHGQF